MKCGNMQAGIPKYSIIQTQGNLKSAGEDTLTTVHSRLADYNDCKLEKALKT